MAYVFLIGVAVALISAAGFEIADKRRRDRKDRALFGRV